MTSMRLLLATFALFPFILTAQSTTTLNLEPGSLTPEQMELNQEVADANGSPVDIIRTLEMHLRKYPDTERRAEFESTIYKYATELNDRARIVVYGEKVLAANPPAGNAGDEIEILDRVLHGLLASDDREAARQALTYAKRYEADVIAKKARDPEGHATAAQWASLADRALARATVLEARAAGNAGNPEEAVATARRSWNVNPTAEAAQEMAHWLAKLGRDAEAIDCYADAVMIDGSLFPWSARDGDRKTASDLYVKLHGNDQGLGDVFLRAWDRSAAAIRERTARYQAMDPNFGLTDAFRFTLPEVDGNAAEGATLDMAKVKGKTLVVDFWATWCVPCIAQHPMIEEVRQKYAADPDVLFLSIDADDDHSVVKPFLVAQKWTQSVYLEGGLGGLLNVSALPTILVIDSAGNVFSRMTGFNGGTFESALSSRIEEARAVTAK